MRIFRKIIFTGLFLPFVLSAAADGRSSLKDAFEDMFYIGAALNGNHIWGRDSRAEDILDTHFNSIVAENCMKTGPLQPFKNVFDFKDADMFVELGEQKGMFIVGHTLIWHSQVPEWFFMDDDGNNVGRAEMIERMRDHITTVVSRYRGRVHGWDVVNEAIMDDGSLRPSKFLEIIGDDYIKLAFEFAHEADPDAELYYNDYSMANPAKRKGVVRLVNDLKEQDVRIDGVGMQGHLSMDYPTVEEFGKSIDAFSDAGVKVMITELDMSVLPAVWGNAGAEVSQNYEYRRKIDPYPDGLPEEVAEKLYERYTDFFDLFISKRDKISRVTLWGVTDSDSWRNGWPVRGRTDYPLLFDRNYQPKPVVDTIISHAQAADIR